MIQVKNKRKYKRKIPRFCEGFLVFLFSIVFFLSRTIRVRNVVPLLEFCLTIKASLKKEYKQCFT